MTPRRESRRGGVELGGRGRKGVAEPEGQIDRIERILEELVQVVQDTQSNTTNAPEQLTIPVPRAEVVNPTTLNSFNS